jgi:formate/nitrite transporter FocA (FNT family)
VNKTAKAKAILINSVLAGIFISIGGMAFLSVDNKIIGAFLFSIGLLATLAFKADLFTGWVCRPEKYKPEMALVFAGNAIGAVITGLISQPQYERAAQLCAAKLDKTYPAWIIGSIVCGICIAIAVRSGDRVRSELIIVLSVMVFILTGGEHVVADMFYFAAARMFSVEIVLRIILCGIFNLIGGLALAFLLKSADQK